ncbi:MAG: ABC transporter ATP-binding protein [Chloroflexota bacterium]|nr:ABC transporter ATP-binding protein [Chloroflexota bacterium]
MRDLDVPGRAVPPPIIESRGLTKRYGRHLALNDLTLSVPFGAIGLLGANGAGKTTLIRVLLGLTTPTAGEARVLGIDTKADPIEVRRRVGFMPESDALPRDATAAEFVGHMAEVSGLPAQTARQRAADVLYQVGLDEERYRLIKGFSTGMKQRVKLAQALVHDPSLVFLDEPTNGLDPRGRDEMLDLVDRIHRSLGIAVVLSSHILEDIERVCTHVIIIDGGRLLVSKTLRATADSEGDVLFRVDGEPAPVVERLRARGFTARAGVGESGQDIVVSPESDEAYDAIRDAVAELGLPLRMLRTRSSSLEDLYIGELSNGTGEVVDLHAGRLTSTTERDHATR